MGDRDSSLRARRAERAREMSVIYAVMACLVLLILVQFLLLMAAVDGYLAGRWAGLLPAAGGSALCFAASCALVRCVVPRREGGPRCG
ncbi:MAG TPA: DUF6755 family protein [Planctomycetota bacterium]|nr:DUF6755 family protein [Planctomycetota bacterium]